MAIRRHPAVVVKTLTGKLKSRPQSLVTFRSAWKMKEEIRKSLFGLLGRLSDKKARPLAAAIEMDRLTGGSEMPHEDILDSLRPALVQAKTHPSRVTTPMRLFCEVFEDLIYVGVSVKKQRGRIDRSSLKPIWRWLAEDLMPDVHANLTEKIRAYIVASDHEKRDRAVAQLHEEAGAALVQALESNKSGTKSYRELSQKLGNSRVVEDARDIAMVLSVAPQMQHLRKLFPKPIVRVSQTDIEALRRYYDFLARNAPSCMPAMFYVLMGRMAAPWLILRVANALVSKTKGLSFSRSKLAFLGNLLLNEVEDLADYISSGLTIDSNVDEILDALNTFAHMTGAITSEIGIDDHGEWSQSLFDCRAIVGRAMELQLERVTESISEALPTVKFGNYADVGLIKADSSSWPDPDKVGLAMNKAALLGGTQQIAPLAAFAAVQGEIIDRVSRFLVDYGDSIVNEIRASEHEDRDRAKAHLETAVRLTQYVLGEAEANVLWQRGLTAAA